MTNSIFNSKEHYLSMRTSWAAAVKNVMSAETKAKLGGERMWLCAEHHVLYNILRGKSFDKGFSPITNINKLKNGMIINNGLYNGTSILSAMQRYANEFLLKGKDTPDFKVKRLNEFLEPFDNMVTVEMLASLEIPEIKRLYPNYGMGIEYTEQILSGKHKPVNFHKLLEAMAVE